MKSCEELTHWKRPWCWKGLGAGGEGDDRGWDGWMASLTRWTWVWVNSGSWWWTGRPGVMWFMGSQRVGHDWATEQTEWNLEYECQVTSVVSDFFVTLLWTIAHQAPLSMGFYGQEYWTGLPWPPPGDLPNWWIESCLFCLLCWQAGSLPIMPPGKLALITMHRY